MKHIKATIRWRLPRRPRMRRMHRAMRRPPVKDAEIQGALTPVAGRMRLAAAALAGTRGAGIGAAVALLCVVASRLWPWETALGWAAGALVAGIPVAAALAWLWPRDVWQVAGAADRGGLKERVTTALEQAGLSPENRSPLAAAQRADALTRLWALDARAVVRVVPDRLALRWAGGLILAAVVTLVLPNPMQATLDRRAIVRTEIKNQQQKIEQLAKDLAQKPLTEEERSKLEKALAELAKELGKSKDVNQALDALGKADEKLGEIIRETAGAPDLSGLAEALSESSLTAEAGRKTAQGDADGARAALQSLADKLSSLSKEERAQLAQALSGAAQAAPGSNTASKLAASAAALQGGEATAAGQSLAEAGQSLAEEMGQSAAAQAAGQAASAVGSARRALTSTGGSVASGDPGQGSGGNQSGSSGQPGQGSGSGQSGQSGSGSGQSGTGSGQGSTGSGQSSGATTGGSGASGASSSGSSNGQASGGPTGQGTAAGQGTAQGGQGQYEQIFDPTRLGGDTDPSYVSGRPGSGLPDAFNTDPGQGRISALAPYNEVYSSYASQAQEALDRTAIPESVKDAVRQYFLSINPGR